MGKCSVFMHRAGMWLNLFALKFLTHNITDGLFYTHPMHLEMHGETQLRVKVIKSNLFLLRTIVLLK